MTKVYLAADFSRMREVCELAQQCRQIPGIEVVSTWHGSSDPGEVRAAERMGGPSPDVARAAAERNLRDLNSSEIVVVLTTGAPARGGRHFETGYAVAAAKKVVIVGPVEHAFHRLPSISVVANADQLTHVLMQLVLD